MAAKSTIINRLFWQSKKRAKNKNIKFTLTKVQFEQIVERANGRCEKSFTHFLYNNEVSEKYSKNPFHPSLDRIDSSKGYEKDNLRLVCVWVNNALSIWGDEIFDRFVLNSVRTSYYLNIRTRKFIYKESRMIKHIRHKQKNQTPCS